MIWIIKGNVIYDNDVNVYAGEKLESVYREIRFTWEVV